MAQDSLSRGNYLSWVPSHRVNPALRNVGLHRVRLISSKTVKTINTKFGGIMEKRTGTLYGIGVGPGEPDLITLKAAKILNQVDIVFAASSTKNTHSLAVNIAGPHIPENAEVKMLRFPMTRDKHETREAWQAHSQTIIAELEKGKNAAFLTLGDSLTYSTYGYVLKAYRNVTDIKAAIDEIGDYPSCVGVKSCGQPNEEIVRDLAELSRCAPDYWTLIIAKQNKKNDLSEG